MSEVFPEDEDEESLSLSGCDDEYCEGEECEDPDCTCRCHGGYAVNPREEEDNDRNDEDD